MARKYDWRRVKKHFSYEIAQAAKTLNCSVATILSWIKLGLPVIADQKPFLIDGHDLREFARQKSEAQKWVKPEINAPWNYFSCFRCKAYRKPILLMVVYIPKGPNKGRLSRNITRRWLEPAALDGTGLPMVRVSRKMIGYWPRDIEIWIADRIVQSTSDSLIMGGRA